MGALFMLGFATGLRCMTPIAVVCWCAWLGYFPVEHTWAAWAGKLVSVIIFTIAALGEWVGDTLPMTPNRTSPFPAASRVIFGGLVGAIASTAYWAPIAGGIIFCILGALAGTWGGFYIRRSLSRMVGHDLPVAIFGSLSALTISCIAAGVQAHDIHKMLMHVL